jgi:hypothetical protein
LLKPEEEELQHGMVKSSKYLKPTLVDVLDIQILSKKGCTRLAAASDKVYQLLVHGRWFYPGTPASSTTKTGRHDIAEILLKVALNTHHSQR